MYTIIVKILDLLQHYKNCKDLGTKQSDEGTSKFLEMFELQQKLEKHFGRYDCNAGSKTFKTTKCVSPRL